MRPSQASAASDLVDLVMAIWLMVAVRHVGNRDRNGGAGNGYDEKSNGQEILHRDSRK